MVGRAGLILLTVLLVGGCGEATDQIKIGAKNFGESRILAEMMAAETWMNGPEAVERGFADEVVENLQVAAAIRDPSRFRNLPAALRPRRVAAMSKIATLRDSLKSKSAR